MTADVHVLARYLAQIRVHRQSGALLVREGSEAVKAYFREGFLVYAHAGEERSREDEALPTDARAALVRQLVVDCFGMPAPTCAFDPVTDEVSRVDELPTAIEPLVLQGIKTHYGEAQVGEVLLDELDRYLSLLVPADRIAERLQLNDAEAGFIAGIDGQETLRFVLANAPLDVLLASQLVTALVLLDLAMAWTEPTSIRPAPPLESEPPEAGRRGAPRTIRELPPVGPAPVPAPGAAPAPAVDPTQPYPARGPRLRSAKSPRRPTAGPAPGPAPGPGAVPAPGPGAGPGAGPAPLAARGLFATLRRAAGMRPAPAEGEKHPPGLAPAEALRERFRRRGTAIERAEAGSGEDAVAEAARAFAQGKTRMNLGDFTAAAELFRRASALAPAEGRYRFYGSWAELQTQAEGPAREGLKVELARQVKATLRRSDDPDEAFAHYVLGRLRILEGDEERGIASLKRALRADPNLVDAARHLRVLEMRRKK